MSSSAKFFQLAILTAVTIALSSLDISKCSNQFSKDILTALKIPESGQGLFIPRSYLQDTGLRVQGDCKFFFVRNEMEKLFSDLHSNVIENSDVRYVLGVPGTGKSFATYTFALTLLDRGYIITWIHSKRYRRPIFVQFRKGQKMHGLLDDAGLGVEEFLSRSDMPGCIHLVILDGVTDSGNVNENLQTGCVEWVLKERFFRRLIIVGSMSSRRKMHDDTEDELRIEETNFLSWTLEEYNSAIKEKEFFASVIPYLDAHIHYLPGFLHLPSVITGVPNAEEMVTSKYHFAGGSSRLMFDCKTSKVIAKIREYVAECHDLFPYLCGTGGERSNIAVNHLLSTYRDSSGCKICIPLSAFATTLIAAKMGCSLVSRLRPVLKRSINPSVAGYLFEMWFFAKLNNGISFRERRGDADIWYERKWEASNIIEFSPTQSMPPITLEGAWMKPLLWNRGGYDAVYINVTSKSVLFVQITQNQRHSFKAHHFQHLLVTMKHVWNLDIKYLDICFLVPNHRAQAFCVEKPTSYGLFEDYLVSGEPTVVRWTRLCELKYVKIVAVDES